MMRYAILLILLVSFTASAYQDINNLNRWQGENVNSLIHSWGTPDFKLIRPSGNSVLVYQVVTTRTYNERYSPSIGVNTQRGIPVMVVDNPNANMPAYYQNNLSLTCTVRFEVNRQGTIISTQSQGNGC